MRLYKHFNTFTLKGILVILFIFSSIHFFSCDIRNPLTNIPHQAAPDIVGVWLSKGDHKITLNLYPDNRYLMIDNNKGTVMGEWKLHNNFFILYNDRTHAIWSTGTAAETKLRIRGSEFIKIPSS
jgi:hypothetical protein